MLFYYYNPTSNISTSDGLISDGTDSARILLYYYKIKYIMHDYEIVKCLNFDLITHNIITTPTTLKT